MLALVEGVTRGRPGLCEQRRSCNRITLSKANIHFGENVHYRLGLDALGNNSHVHNTGHFHDHFNHDSIDLAVENFPNEATVYFNVIDW